MSKNPQKLTKAEREKLWEEKKSEFFEIWFDDKGNRHSRNADSFSEKEKEAAIDHLERDARGEVEFITAEQALEDLEARMKKDGLL